MQTSVWFLNSTLNSVCLSLILLQLSKFFLLFKTYNKLLTWLRNCLGTNLYVAKALEHTTYILVLYLLSHICILWSNDAKLALDTLFYPVGNSLMIQWWVIVFLVVRDSHYTVVGFSDFLMCFAHGKLVSCRILETLSIKLVCPISLNTGL